MHWFEIFPVFVVCHLAGDYLIQTDWQAVHKQHGLGSDPVARRALGAHVATYTLAYSPALIWLAPRVGAATIAVVALLVVPHLIQDDGRLLEHYMRAVKHACLGRMTRSAQWSTRASTCWRCLGSHCWAAR